MKILKDNYTKLSINETVENLKPYPRKLICEHCGSSLEYEEVDLRVGFLGCAYLDCPLCSGENMIEDNENTITLTKDNVRFPVHFYHISTESGAVDYCNDKEVRECVDRAIEYFRNNKDECHYTIACGNLYVSVDRCEDDESYDIVVSNNYYETFIPFEREDY